MAHMPDTNGELRKLPRAWIINVAATVVGKPFIDWIKAKIQERNAKAAREQNLLIKMDPSLAAAFGNSTHFSRKYSIIPDKTAVSKGSGAHMLKVGSKRRRTKQQIADDKERADREKLDVEQKMAQYEALLAEKEKMEKLAKNNQGASDLLNGFIKEGSVWKDDAGNWVVTGAQGSAASVPGSKSK